MIELSDEWLKIYDEDEFEVFNDVPVIAIGTKDNGDEHVVAIGKNAILHAGYNTKIYKPFSNSRFLIDDYEVAANIIRYAIEQGLNRKLFFSPRMIVQITRTFQNDITPVEYKVLEEVMLNARAREVIIKS
jgi:actin-like ATPase involved in cell morphogenesis